MNRESLDTQNPCQALILRCCPLDGVLCLWLDGCELAPRLQDVESYFLRFSRRDCVINCSNRLGGDCVNKRPVERNPAIDNICCTDGLEEVGVLERRSGDNWAEPRDFGELND